MTVVACVMMLDSLETERQLSGQNKILYMVENSITVSV